MKKDQRGSVELVIIGVLVVALLGAVGYIGWSKFRSIQSDSAHMGQEKADDQKRRASDSDQQNKLDVETKLIKATYDDWSLLFDIPKSWESAITTPYSIPDYANGKYQGSAPVKKLAITDPGKTVEIAVTQQRHLYVDGVCPPSKIIKLEKKPLKSSLDLVMTTVTSHRVSEEGYAISKEEEAIHRTATYLYPKGKELDDLKIGGDSCVVRFGSVFDRSGKFDQNASSPIAQVTVNMLTDNVSQVQEDTNKTVIQVLNSMKSE